MKKFFILKCIIIFISIFYIIANSNDSILAQKTKLPVFEKGLKGIQLKNNEFYLLDDNSKIQKGWQNYCGNLYYFSKKTGKMFFGVKKIGKSYYYFDENGCCVIDVAFNKNKSLRHGFYQDKKNTFYYYNGILIKGFATIDGVNYYFDETTGVMKDYEVALKNYQNQFGVATEDIMSKNTTSKTVTAKNIVVHDGYYNDPYIDDRTLLAAIITCEAGNQKAHPLITSDNKQVYQGQLAVGYVIANRVNSNLGLKEIIYKKNQFTPARNGRLSTILHNTNKIPKYCYNAADVVLSYMNEGKEMVPSYKKSDFHWNNFWGYSYAKDYTNFFNILKIENNDYQIIEDHIFFNYNNLLKQRTAS